MTTKLLLVFEILMIATFFVFMSGIAVVFFLGGGFGSPIQFAFFATGVMVTLTNIYLVASWASEIALDRRYA